MEYWKCLWMVVVAFLLGGSRWWECEGCWEHEKTALLQLKPFFNHIEDIENYWAEGNQSRDCCEWERVECNNSTGRVIQLFLNRTLTEDSIYNWHLNASLFLPFKELNSLYLSSNSIAGCVDNQGFERLSSKLDKLKILDLSDNYFNDNVLASLSELSSLKSLNLRDNKFTGLNPTDGIKWLSKLNKLETLDLSGNTLGNNFLSHLAGFTSLKTLSLWNCGLKGTIDMSEFNNLKHLRELYLSSNEIESLGSLLQDEGELRLAKLEVLDLSYNLFNNSIFSSLAALSNLKSLSIENNKLEGTIHIEETKKELRLMDLEVLDLIGNHFNTSILPFLSSLSNLKSLYLDLESNKLEGLIDLRELHALKNLEELSISCSFGKGMACSLSLPSLGIFTSLKLLYLEGFNFNGIITTQNNERELRLMNLEELHLGWNLFNSSTLSFFDSLSNLKSLNLDYNKVEGPIDLRELHSLRNLEELVIDCGFAEDIICSFSLQSLDICPSLKTLSLIRITSNETMSTKRWQNLTSLQELTLSYLSLPSNFIQNIETLTSLKSLDVKSYEFNGGFNFHGWQNLTSLEELTLHYSYLPSNFIQNIETLTSLKSLYVEGFEFNGRLNFHGWKNLTNLKELTLKNSSLPANFIQGFCELRQLQKLDISDNNLKAKLPECFSNLTSLEYLDLSYNQFFGSISVIKSLISLRVLGLSSNNFQIPISLVPLFNLSKLENIYADNNAIYAETDRHPLAPTFQLRHIDLSCCGDVRLFPQFLYHQHDLEYVDLSNIYFKGDQFPIWLLENNRKLQSLYLCNNSLSGHLELSFLSPTDLSYLEISKNSIDGNIPNEIGAKLPSLKILNMSNNYFGGSIPASIGDMQFLEVLDLSNNTLTGGLPKQLAMNLKEIILANNHLEGPIPMEFCQLNLYLRLFDLSVNNISGSLPSCFSPRRISQVHLSRNKLEGPITNAFCNSTILVTLDLSNNHLTGNIPNWIGKLSQLSYLLLNNNHFEGKIPFQLCKLDHLSIIDLSSNNLSGTIPHCLKITTLNDIFDDYRRYVFNVTQERSFFSMEEPIEFTTKNVSYHYKRRVLGYLSGIDLSCNNLTGEIPHEVKNFQYIIVLNLSHNSLIGPIPPTVSDLNQIESLDLSYNKLSGKIPSQLVRLNFLSFFSVAFNNLSGSTPQRIAQFATFENSSYLGNPFLCGTPLQKNCSTDGPTSSMPKTSTEDGFIDMNVFYVSFVVSYVIVLLSIATVLYINPYWRQAWFYHIEVGITSCYYFVIDNVLPKRFHWGNT